MEKERSKPLFFILKPNLSEDIRLEIPKFLTDYIHSLGPPDTNALATRTCDPVHNRASYVVHDISDIVLQTESQKQLFLGGIFEDSKGLSETDHHTKPAPDTGKLSMLGQRVSSTALLR